MLDLGLVVRRVFLLLVSGRAQRQHRWSSAGFLLSAQEGEVTFGAFVGVVALLAALGHTQRTALVGLRSKQK